MLRRDLHSLRRSAELDQLRFELSEVKLRRVEIDLEEANLQLNDTMRLNKQLEKLARIDGLTNLANHRALKEQVDKIIEIANTTISTDDTKYLIILTDVDHFKKFNDRYGHVSGDNALRFFADKLRSSVRAGILGKRTGDIVARYGGEEFAAVLPIEKDGDIPCILYRILQNTNAEPVPGLESRNIRITTSIGALCITGKEIREGKFNFESLFEEADALLYTAKGNGLLGEEGRNNAVWKIQRNNKIKKINAMGYISQFVPVILNKLLRTHQEEGSKYQSSGTGRASPSQEFVV